MIASTISLLASFTVPCDTGNGPNSLLWILPLLAAVAIVWKVLKQPAVVAAKLVQEVVVLFVTLLVCYAGIGAALYIIGRLVLS